MTTEKIIEGNKLIAEFMGYVYYPEDTLNDIKGVLRKEGRGGLHLDHSKPFHPEYHSSWDWLMPVVEKIESIEDAHRGYFGVHISSNGCTIQATNLRTDKPIANPPHYFDDVTLDTKINSTWYAVTRFVQWYNTTLH